MKDSLGLSDEQAKKLDPVLKEQQDRMNALRRDTSLSRKDRVAKLKEIQTATNSKIKAQLAPEQEEKWQKRGLGAAQLSRPQGQTTSTASPLSISGRSEKGGQPLPNWQSRSQQPPQAQPQAQPPQQVTPK